MTPQPDLWGEIGTGQIKSPVAILREQAALLGSKTQNLVEARVETSTFRDTFHHEFVLFVPALDYKYQLFKVSHGVDMYPIETTRLVAPVVSDAHHTAWPGYVFLNDEEEFVQWLHEKLSSPETKKIIANLLAQVAN
jgi:hypothetical protein